jgi:predicted CoA-binding protein
VDDLMAANIAVVELTSIANRDAFVVENYERRNGFDVIIRVGRELARVVNDVERVETSGETIF